MGLFVDIAIGVRYSLGLLRGKDPFFACREDVLEFIGLLDTMGFKAVRSIVTSDFLFID